MTTNELSRTEIQKNKFWNMLRLVIGTLAIEESQSIVKHLLDQKQIRSKDLIHSTGIPNHRFHVVMKKLVEYNIVTRKVTQDNQRAVYYELSPYGADIINLSKPLLKEIKKKVQKTNVIKPILSHR